ncbi:MAG: hypothetical protein AB1816_05150, partial [Bacillota bacterium]
MQAVPVDATSVIARAVPWEQCPAFAGINPVRGKREGHVLLADRDSGMLLLAIRQWGRGPVGVFSSDITAIWGEDFNRWEHFPAFMGALLGCLAGPAPGMGAREAAVAGAAAGAALPLILGWLSRALETLGGWAEKKRLLWVAWATRYVSVGLREGTVYVRSLRAARKWEAFWAKVGRVSGAAGGPLLVGEAMARGTAAYRDLPPQALASERWARGINGLVRSIFSGLAGFAVGSVVAMLFPGGPLLKGLAGASAGYIAEGFAESLYDGAVSGRVQGILLARLIGRLRSGDVPVEYWSQGRTGAGIKVRLVKQLGGRAVEARPCPS